jgi:hypothetical protein
MDSEFSKANHGNGEIFKDASKADKRFLNTGIYT